MKVIAVTLLNHPAFSGDDPMALSWPADTSDGEIMIRMQNRRLAVHKAVKCCGKAGSAYGNVDFDADYTGSEMKVRPLKAVLKPTMRIQMGTSPSMAQSCLKAPGGMYLGNADR